MRSFEKVLPLAFATAVGRRRVTAVLRRSAWVLAWLILLVHTNQGAWAASDGSGFIPGLEAKRPTNGPGVLGSASGLVGASRAEIELIPIGPGIWVEKLQGSAAVAHLGNLMAKRPDAFSEAGRSMREKGYNPTDVVYVERMIQFLPVRGIIPGAAIIPAEQYSESDGNAEIVYWSWDNGDDST